MILTPGQIVAMTPEGGYASPLKFAVVAVFAMGWLWLAPRLYRDTVFANAKTDIWCTLYLAAGMLGLAVWLLAPHFAIGLIAFPLLVAMVGFAYIPHRNSLVDDHLKIFTAEWFANRGEKKGHGGLTIHQRIKLYSHDGRPVVLSEDDELDSDVIHEYNLAQDLLHAAAVGRASEVDVAPRDEETAAVRFVVDGVVGEQPFMGLEEAETLIQYIKDKAGLDVEDRDSVQRGKISIDIAGSPVDMEVATAGTSAGQRLRIRVIQELIQTNANVLGMDEAMLDRVGELMQGNGLLIVSAPPKQGVTSTQYSLLKKQDPYMRMLATVEAKSVTDLENITQEIYGETENLPKQLATLMRRDPDVIMVDQVPGQETAELICDFSKEKYVIIGLNAKDTFGALAKWLKLRGEAQAALAPCRAVLCQFLIRKLCPDCREAYQPDPALLKKLGLPPERVGQLYRPPTAKPQDKDGEIIPCETCGDNGYYGRTGVFELLEVDDTIKQIMMAGPTRDKLKAAARKNKMVMLREQALRKVLTGETSLEEVVRVMQQLK